MAHRVFIGYNKIFGDSGYSESDFLKNIPISLAISICSYMSSKLYMRQNLKKIQLELFKFFIRRQPKDLQFNLYVKIRNYVNGGGQIFLSLYLNVFLKFCLDNCRDFEYDDLDTRNDLLILKAYVNQADIFNSTFTISSNQENQHDFFRVNNWPIYLGQIHHNLELNPLTTFFKGILILDFFKRNEELNEFYKEYLNHYNVNSHTHFLQILMQFIKEAVKNKDQFFIKTDEFGIKFFLNFEFKISEYRKRRNKDIYIMSNPLFKANNNSFYVLNYNYLANKLYHGVIFDFFNRAISPKKNFLEFKSFVGGAFIEKSLFRKVISTIFKQNFYHVYFDDDNREGFPDALVIRKNKVFIFEVKDALLSHSTIQSKDYDEIKKEIDKFFVEKKGVTQIANFLKKLMNSETPNIGGYDLRLTKLDIVPIVIYTDTSFNLPGIGDYLNNKFQSCFSSKHRFKKINEVLFINIDFLIEYLDVLQKGDASFEKSIDKIYFLMRKKKRLLEKNKTTKYLDEYHQLFDQYFYSVNSVNEKRKSYVKFVYKELEIENSI